MRGLFPQYADTSEQNYANVWNQALFVFDTNVLLNLYRYQSSTRDELLNVLEQLSERTWAPHHVALEFQRNRLKVIAEQNKRFSEVRRTIEKARSSLFVDLEKLQLQRRHSLINPQPLTTGFEKLVADFLAELDRLQETQQKLSAPDPLKAKIEALFDGRVGASPKDQAAIDKSTSKRKHGSNSRSRLGTKTQTKTRMSLTSTSTAASSTSASTETTSSGSNYLLTPKPPI
jgi:hypothetical protein